MVDRARLLGFLASLGAATAACEAAPPIDDDGAPGKRTVATAPNEPVEKTASAESRSPGAPAQVTAGCATDADCTSGVCGQAGPAKGQCLSRRSCAGAPGADRRCGTGQTDDCCAASLVPAGSFVNKTADGSTQSAKLEGYGLDDFEITVGRLRTFVDAQGGRLREHAPAAGAGAHPRIPKSGWRRSFDVRLPESRAALNERLTDACAVAGGTTSYGSSTWTAAPGPNEDKPVTCIDWYTAFAFCAWDGGRLPTDAEWSMAAVGGAEQRKYSWGNDAPFYETHRDVVVSTLLDRGDGAFMFTEGAPYREANDGALQIARVGKHTERGRWGQADLTGNVLEWVLDRAQFTEGSCTDCADVAWPDPPQGDTAQPPDWIARSASGAPLGSEFSETRSAPDGERFVRGSSFQGTEGGHALVNYENRHYYPVWRTYGAIGARCAR